MKEAILDLLLEAAESLDAQRFEDWAGCFTEDARYRVTTAENLRKGYPVSLIDCMGKPMMMDRLFGLKSANVFEPHAYRHILSPSRIRATAPQRHIPTHAARTSFLVARTMESKEAGLFLSGYYDDVVVETPQGPRLAQRTVVLDSSLIDLLIVIPV